MAFPSTGDAQPRVSSSPRKQLSHHAFDLRDLHLGAVKSALVTDLMATKGQLTASEMLQESSFSVEGNTLKIQTDISEAMLPVVFNAEAHRIMNATLQERGAAKLQIHLLATSPKTKRAPAEKVGQPEHLDQPESSRNSVPFKKLIDTAAKLNKVSDQLTAQIEQIDTALKRLNLGVSAWVTIREERDEDGNWSLEELGYTRIGSRWGVALRIREGLLGEPDPDDSFYGFCDAPRQMRIRAIQHVPALIERLSVEAEEMIAKLSPKVDEITELTRAVQALAGGGR